MSIVNQMLRDLEKQKQSGNQFDLQAVTTDYSNLSKLTIALFVSVLVIGAIWWPNEDTSSATATLSSDEQKLSSTYQPLSDAKTYSLTAKNETQPSANYEVIQTPPVELVIEKKKITETSPENSQKPANLRQNSRPTKSSPMDTTINQRDPDPVGSLTTTDKSIQSSSNDNSVIASAPVKQETLASQLNRQLQQILAMQDRVGIRQTIVRLEDLVIQNPQFEKAHLSLIKLAWQIEYDSLEKSLLFAVEQNPGQPAFRIAAARYYLQQENYSKAETIIQSKPGNKFVSPSLLQVRALIYQKQNKHQLAVNDYALLLKQTKKKAGVYLALAISLEALGRVDKAEQSYRNALRENQLNSRQTEFVRSKLLYLKG